MIGKFKLLNAGVTDSGNLHKILQGDVLLIPLAADNVVIAFVELNVNFSYFPINITFNVVRRVEYGQQLASYFRHGTAYGTPKRLFSKVLRNHLLSMCLPLADVESNGTEIATAPNADIVENMDTTVQMTKFDFANDRHKDILSKAEQINDYKITQHRKSKAGVFFIAQYFCTCGFDHGNGTFSSQPL